MIKGQVHMKKTDIPQSSNQFHIYKRYSSKVVSPKVLVDLELDLHGRT